MNNEHIATTLPVLQYEYKNYSDAFGLMGLLWVFSKDNLALLLDRLLAEITKIYASYLYRP